MSWREKVEFSRSDVRRISLGVPPTVEQDHPRAFPPVREAKAPRRLVRLAVVLLVLLVLPVMAAPATVHAADVWVDAAAPAGGDGSMASPLQSLQDGLQAAMPGDVVRVLPGTYGAITTVRDGTRGDRIRVVSERAGEAVVAGNGTALAIDHRSHGFEGLVFDCGFGAGDCVRGGGDDLELLDVEVRNATGDCIDLRQTSGVLVERARIHHCIGIYDPENNADSHGITGDSVFDLTVVDSEIYLTTGDSIQLSPPREPWGNVRVERCSLWTGPLDIAVNGWQKGQRIGENAFDSKVGPEGDGTGQDPIVVFTDIDTWGWREVIGNQGAFNVKETVDFTLDRASIHDSELGFRLREPATVRIHNVVVWDVDSAFRFESGLPEPVVLNTTIGGEIAGEMLQEVDGGVSGGDFRNVLVLGDMLPALFADPSNLAVDGSAFVDALGHGYHLVMGGPPVDAGVAIAEVAFDRDGIARPVGAGHDIGAFEWTDAPPPGDTDDGTDPSGTAGDDDGPGGSGDDTGASEASLSGGSGEPTGGDGSAATDGSGNAAGDGGCACRAASGQGAPAWLGFAVVVAIARGRGRRAAAQNDADA